MLPISSGDIDVVHLSLRTDIDVEELMATASAGSYIILYKCPPPNGVSCKPLIEPVSFVTWNISSMFKVVCSNLWH